MIKSKKKEKEQELVALMISLHCKGKHKSKQLCDECVILEKYVFQQIERCRFSEQKDFCNNCISPCYKPDMKAQIRMVMKYSGPRMMIYHPTIALKHVWASLHTKR